jgi:hypothetical protein
MPDAYILIPLAVAALAAAVIVLALLLPPEH